MFSLKSLLESLVYSILPSDTTIVERIKKNRNEVDMKIQNGSNANILKILSITRIKEDIILKFHEYNTFLIDYSIPSIYPSKPFQINIHNEYIFVSRDYYLADLEEIIQNNSLSIHDICVAIRSICDIFIVLSELNVFADNLKSSNVIYDDEGETVKICDLWLNSLRKEEDIKIYDLYFRSSEELNGLEVNERSVIWSIGCILYEMINKKLPFAEDENLNKTRDNIVVSRYSLDIDVDDMKVMIETMLKVRNKDRMSLKELRKEMIKMSKVLKDSKKDLMIVKERKETLYNNDLGILVVLSEEYYLDNQIDNKIRDDLINHYNNNSNERLLSMLLMIKLYTEDKSIKERLNFQIYHECEEDAECYLDEKVFNIYVNKDKFRINSKCFCICEEGITYLFKILSLINPKKLKFRDFNHNIEIPFPVQPLYGSLFSHISNLQELDLSGCNLTFYFIETFVKSIPLMKLKYLNIESNPIGPEAFQLIIPHLRLLINKNNELIFENMDLDDESMKLLSEELYKYPKISKLYIKGNQNIHSKGLKDLFSIIHISKIVYNSYVHEELEKDERIAELIKYIKSNPKDNQFNLSNSEMDDKFKSFISLRSDELEEIEELDLSNNKLKDISIYLLINNLSSFSNLKHLQLHGNIIGDEGMKLLSPHIHLLCNYNNNNLINCSKMGISSFGLKYIVGGLNAIHHKIRLDISGNVIFPDGIEYLMNYVENNNNIETLNIHDNPIRNDGFKLLLKQINILVSNNEVNLSNISINRESVMLLTKKIKSISECKMINLIDNDIDLELLKSICSKSLEKKKYPFIKYKPMVFEEKIYYFEYCAKKKRYDDCREFDFSNINLNDYYISLIKQIDYDVIDLSNNSISYRGLIEFIDSLPKDVKFISIHNNPIRDEGVEIICKYLDKFVDDNQSLNLSNIKMSKKGLKMLIERLKDYRQLRGIDITGYKLSDRELRLMKENNYVFDYLDKLSITLKVEVHISELRTFFDEFSNIETIEINGNGSFQSYLHTQTNLYNSHF